MPAKLKSSESLSDDAIRQRAYFLWEADGRPHGHSDHYWKLASVQVRTAKPRAKAAAAAVPETKAKPKVAKAVKSAKPVKKKA